MTQTRYINWDYDTKQAIEYERLGECNGCGECCMALIRFDIEKDCEDAREGSTTAGIDGIWTEHDDREKRRFFRFQPVDASKVHICPMLTYTKKCLLHEKGKQLIHSGWPFCPENVTPFKSCSYSFREISRWEFTVDPA